MLCDFDDWHVRMDREIKIRNTRSFPFVSSGQQSHDDAVRFADANQRIDLLSSNVRNGVPRVNNEFTFSSFV